MYKSVFKLSKYLKPEQLVGINMEPIIEFAKDELKIMIVNANEIDISLN